jgi:hypothetical protein
LAKSPTGIGKRARRGGLPSVIRGRRCGGYIGAIKNYSHQFAPICQTAKVKAPLALFFERRGRAFILVPHGTREESPLKKRGRSADKRYVSKRTGRGEHNAAGTRGDKSGCVSRLNLFGCGSAITRG